MRYRSKRLLGLGWTSAITASLLAAGCNASDDQPADTKSPNYRLNDDLSTIHSLPDGATDPAPLPQGQGLYIPLFSPQDDLGSSLDTDTILSAIDSDTYVAPPAAIAKDDPNLAIGYICDQVQERITLLRKKTPNASLGVICIGGHGRSNQTFFADYPSPINDFALLEELLKRKQSMGGNPLCKRILFLGCNSSAYLTDDEVATYKAFAGKLECAIDLPATINYIVTQPTAYCGPMNAYIPCFNSDGTFGQSPFSNSEGFAVADNDEKAGDNGLVYEIGWTETANTIPPHMYDKLAQNDKMTVMLFPNDTSEEFQNEYVKKAKAAGYNNIITSTMERQFGCQLKDTDPFFSTIANHRDFQFSPWGVFITKPPYSIPTIASLEPSTHISRLVRHKHGVHVPELIRRG